MEIKVKPKIFIHSWLSDDLLSRLEKYFNINIELKDAEEIDTVGGMLVFIANKVPKNNQVYHYNSIIQFKVLKASARRIEQLEIKKIK